MGLMAKRSLPPLVALSPLLHTETQNPSLQSALAVRHVVQKEDEGRRCCCCKVVRLGFIGICLS